MIIWLAPMSIKIPGGTETRAENRGGKKRESGQENKGVVQGAFKEAYRCWFPHFHENLRLPIGENAAIKD